MKSYTDINQSKKLAEILPLESADMYLWSSGKRYYIEAMDDGDFNEEEGHVPSWSLAALLRELPDTMLGKDKDGYVVMVETMGSGLTTFASNPVDACYEMVLKLKEKNLL